MRQLEKEGALLDQASSFFKRINLLWKDPNYMQKRGGKMLKNKRQKKWMTLGLICMAWIGISQIAMANLLDKILLHPTREPKTGVGGEKKMLLSGSEVWIHRKAGSSQALKDKWFVLHFIGNASRAEDERPEWIDYLPEHISAEVWSVNYPGFGGSRGKAKLSEIPAASFRVYEEALVERNLVGRASPLILSGNSLGTTVALYLATQAEAQGIVLRNPPPIRKMIRNFGGWTLSWLTVPTSLFFPNELDSLENAARIHIPCLFFTSENDQIVPVEMQNKIMKKYQGPWKQEVFKGIGHNDYQGYRFEREITEGVGWLIKNL